MSEQTRTATYPERAATLLLELQPDLPAELVDLYTLLALTRGEQTSLVDVHDAWSVWRMRTRPEHPSLVAFRDLSFEVQELDRPYVDAIHAVARRMRGVHR